jgi:hypothetical protein
MTFPLGRCFSRQNHRRRVLTKIVFDSLWHSLDVPSPMPRTNPNFFLMLLYFTRSNIMLGGFFMPICREILATAVINIKSEINPS